MACISASTTAATIDAYGGTNTTPSAGTFAMPCWGSGSRRSDLNQSALESRREAFSVAKIDPRSRLTSAAVRTSSVCSRCQQLDPRVTDAPCRALQDKSCVVADELSFLNQIPWSADVTGGLIGAHLQPHVRVVISAATLEDGTPVTGPQELIRQATTCVATAIERTQGEVLIVTSTDSVICESRPNRGSFAC
jgi:hypothetical protein